MAWIISSSSGDQPSAAFKWISVPSKVKTAPRVARHSVLAAEAIASKVGWTSVGELEMTRRISAVAVWRSSASRCSVMSRVFSIAITAWSAKVRTSSICRSVNGCDPLPRDIDHADHDPLAQQRHAERGP